MTGQSSGATSDFDLPYLRSLVAIAQGLKQDLNGIVEGRSPSADDLAEAPVLDGWWLGVRPVPVLFGSATGHPLLGNRRIWTSPIWLIDPAAVWARTQSRYYRLGRRIEELERSDG